jgi:hypothetical protein
MPTVRQLATLAALWGVVAWLVAAAWGVMAQQAELGDAFTRYYAIRAPFVGAVAGLVWAPVLTLGALPGRASALAGRRPGLAVERRTRQVLRVLQGLVTGQLIGATATFMLLFLWPNDMQNTRMDALKWGVLFWRLYWYLFVPCGALAGLLSVWVAMAHARPRARPAG